MAAQQASPTASSEYNTLKRLLILSFIQTARFGRFGSNPSTPTKPRGATQQSPSMAGGVRLSHISFWSLKLTSEIIVRGIANFDVVARVRDNVQPAAGRGTTTIPPSLRGSRCSLNTNGTPTTTLRASGSGSADMF